MIRFGFPALVTALYVGYLPAMIPHTTDLSSWYAGCTWAVVLTIGLLALDGFRHALGGQSLLKGELLEAN